MAKKKKLNCQEIFYARGDVILRAMTGRGLTVVQLASRAEVAEQTVRNYLNSNEGKPWPVDLEKLKQVCRVLKIEPESSYSIREVPTTPRETEGDAADLRFRFVGDSRTVRSVEGVWDAQSIDKEIPGLITYTDPGPWSAKMTIRQYGNRFEATGKDMGDDGVLAIGTLLENGNWARFEYWVDNTKLREYGTAMVEFKGCGRIMEGLFMGRDHGHSSNGMVVAHLTLTLDEEASEAFRISNQAAH